MISVFMNQFPVYERVFLYNTQYFVQKIYSKWRLGKLTCMVVRNEIVQPKNKSLTQENGS